MWCFGLVSCLGPAQVTYGLIVADGVLIPACLVDCPHTLLQKTLAILPKASARYKTSHKSTARSQIPRGLQPHANTRLVYSLATSSSTFSSTFPAVALSPAPARAATIFLTASTVPAGLPGSARMTLPALSTTKTPRWVPLGDFLSPMAAIRVALGSQRRG